MTNPPVNMIVELNRIFLDPENPRHEPCETQGEIIEFLCQNENIYQLAKDIREHGLNPLELFALIPDDEGLDDDKETFFVAEGNRRICALKLLDDPELAPSKYRKVFEAASEGWEGISTLSCVFFEDRKAVDLWLRRIHDGEQGGIGRRKWNADQSARHSGDKKNKVALAVLDYAEENQLISGEDRKGKLTTVQRYFVNQEVREAMGIDVSNPDKVYRNRSRKDFDLLLTKFLDDLLKGEVHSRSKKADIQAYAREIRAVSGQSHQEIPPEPLDAPAQGGKGKKRKRRPQKPKFIGYLPYDQDVMDALEDLGRYKLPHLYSSICNIKLESHTPLLAIGAWAFMESLSAKAGRSGAAFSAFFSKQRLRNYGLATEKGDKSINEALNRLADAGNVTKHHKTAALFSGEQLANDMETLTPLILKCIEEAKGDA